MNLIDNISIILKIVSKLQMLSFYGCSKGDEMVITGHRYSKSTFGGKKMHSFWSSLASKALCRKKTLYYFISPSKQQINIVQLYTRASSTPFRALPETKHLFPRRCSLSNVNNVNSVNSVSSL